LANALSSAIKWLSDLYALKEVMHMFIIQHSLSFLRAKWRDLLAREATISEPGFVGRIPYLLGLRWLILLGILLRFILFGARDVFGRWTPAILSISLIIMVVLTLAATYIYLIARPSLKHSVQVHGMFVWSDVLLISLFYWLTGSNKSDLFLFYCLPLLAAAEYFDGIGVLRVYLIIAGAFAVIILALLPTSPESTKPGVLLRAFMPREIFFLSVIVGASFLRRLERIQKDGLSQREAEMRALLGFKARMDQIFELEQALTLTIAEATNSVGANGGHILLVDYQTGQLELKSFTPDDYIKDVDVLVEEDYMARQVVQQRRPLRLADVSSESGLSKAFDSRIRALVYVPIITHNTVLGVLSVGSTTPDRFGDDAERFLQALVAQVASAIEKARLLAALREIGGAAASVLELDLELDSILEDLTDRLGFEFAAISLVDDYRRTIEMIRGKNIPPAWVRRSKHTLDSADIQAVVVRTKKTAVIDGWDERLDREIYDRFGHANLARIFAPIIVDGAIVGTIEAGCQRERRAEILTSDNIEEVERLGQAKGAAVARIRPYALLELIANRAIEIIGADSASVHVYQLGQLTLEAGAGKATKEFLHRFPPRTEGGIGREAMRENKYVVIDQPEDLIARHKALYDAGVKAIAAFPLDVGAGVQGVLYVHFWHDHRFSQAELELEAIFARQMVIVLQDNLLLKDITETTERVWSLSRLQNVTQSLVSSFDLTHVLDEVAQNVLYILDADNVILYQFHLESGRFEVPLVVKGTFRDRDAMQLQKDPDSVVWNVMQEGKSRFIEDISRDPMLSEKRNGDVDRPRFVEREEIKSSAHIVLRAGEADEIVGLMFVNYRTPHIFEMEEQKTINALASSAAIAIKTARLYERVKHGLEKRDKELGALRAVDRAIVLSASAPDLQPILELILDKALEIIEAPTGDIMWYNRWADVLELKARRGVPPNCEMLRQRPGEGIVGQAALERKSILVHDVTVGEWPKIYIPLIPGTRSELAVPLMDESGLLGVLNVEHPEAGAFDEDDRALLEMLAVQAVIAVHTVDLYQKLEKQIKSLRSLILVAPRIQDASYDLDTVLRLLLTGVTAGDGLCHSRAMLFLTNDNGENQLRGKMAIGAQTREEAEATWKRLDEEASRLMTGGERDILTSLLDQAQEFSNAVAERRESDCPLSLAVQGISVPIEEGRGALSTCILEERVIIVKDGQDDPFRNVIEQVSQPGDKGCAFACMPLMGKGGAIGALVVDNRFLMSEKEIDEIGLDCLAAYADVAAMSVENARLRARLAKEQRRATWKEFTARVAHIIGGRIAVIGGSVTMLRYSLLEGTTLEGKQWIEVQNYLKGLSDGIHKANTVLVDFRRFAAPLELRFEPLDLIQVLQGAVREIQYGLNFPIELTLPDVPLNIQGDPVSLSDVFTELIRNAQEAMQQDTGQQDTGREPHMTITVSVEALPAAPGAVAQIEFADTGPGVPESDKQRLFEPFFSTKGRGSGLGLAIIKNTIEQHKGTIEETGTFGIGARFIVRLPVIG
jgi:GAF domain-containing protein/signal transduction histidine kinase